MRKRFANCMMAPSSGVLRARQLTPSRCSRSRSIGNTRHVRPSVLQSPAQHPIWRGMSANERSGLPVWHGTTILSVRKNGKVVVAGDGQVSMGQTVMKPNAKKVRQLHDGSVIGGFAGATADAFTLFERSGEH